MHRLMTIGFTRQVTDSAFLSSLGTKAAQLLLARVFGDLQTMTQHLPSTGGLSTTNPSLAQATGCSIFQFGQAAFAELERINEPGSFPQAV